MRDDDAGPMPGAAARLLATAPPAVGTAEAMAALSEHYGPAATARPLAGERDRNFMVETLDGARRVFKVFHEAEDAATRAFQTGALRHVARAAPGCAVPRLVPTRRGADECPVVAGGRILSGILITALPGASGDLAGAGADLRRDIGRAAAEVDLALRHFSHPAEDRVLLWDHMRLGLFAEVAERVADAGTRRWLAGFVARFVEEILPQAATLPTQVIHNDLNGGNVLRADGTVVGIIDFGDIVRAPRVNEIAVAATYCLAAGRDPIAAIGDVVEGYETRSRLEEAEMALLHDLVLARLALRLLMYHWRAGLFPDRRDALIRNAAMAWPCAEALTGRDPRAGRDAILRRWAGRRRR